MKVKCILPILSVCLLFQVCQKSSDSKRKIKLSDGRTATRTEDQLTTTIHLEPTLRRAVAVMFFQNQTGDQNLQWLQKGLTEMFIRALSQSPQLSVLSTDRLVEIIERLGRTDAPEQVDINMAAIVAQEADVEALVSGNISRAGDSLRINVKVHEPRHGQVLREESIEGPGLEAIFGMVDNLTQRIKSHLQLSLAAEESSKSITDLSTNSMEAWRCYTAGIDLITQFLTSDAIPQLEKAIELDPDFISAHIELCTLHLNRKNHKSAFKSFKRLQTLTDNATPKERYRINLLEARFKNDVAALTSTMKEWLKNDPDDRDANYALASLYSEWNNREKAIEYFKKVLDIDPKYKLAYNRLGYEFAHTGYLSKAVALMKKYKETAPEEANPHDSMGEVYFWYGDYKNAEKQYKRALRINENFHASTMNLAYLYFEKGEYEKAVKTYETYLEKIPDDISKSHAYEMTARAYDRMGNTDKAIEYYLLALKYNASNLVSLERLHNVYIENDDKTTANEILLEAYNRQKERWHSDHMQLGALFYLAVISLGWNVNTYETIDIFTDVLETVEKQASPAIDQINLTDIRFFLTLFYIQTNQIDKINKIWLGVEIIPENLWKILKGAQLLTYSGNWRFFSILNTLYYQYPDSGSAFYEPLIKQALAYEAKSVEMMFRLLLTDLLVHRGSEKKSNWQLEKIGMPAETKWMVIGPFDNEDGFRKKYPPEKRIHLDKIYREKSWNVTWQEAQDSVNDGFISLRDNFKRYEWSAAYGLTLVYSPEEKKVQLRVGTDDGGKLWFNDKEIWGLNQGGPAIFDDNKIDVTLKKGINKILIKVCNGLGDWGFFFRITDEEGNGVSDIQFISPDQIRS